MKTLISVQIESSRTGYDLKNQIEKLLDAGALSDSKIKSFSMMDIMVSSPQSQSVTAEPFGEIYQTPLT